MPLIVVPIRTEAAVRRTPLVNYWLIAINIFAFLAFDPRFAGELFSSFARDHLFFRSYTPALHQFVTYQFLHGDVGHLLGNMLFLWVFGNSVCGKMGGGPYLIFYIAAGIFAAWANAMFKPEAFYLIGASGSIAGVTTAYLALFPRSYVTVLVWLFFFIHFFELPAMIIIGLKIIVWDNIIAPGLGGSEQVAHLAHLGGYLFGFVAALTMLMVRGVARDQFDILGVWSRWGRRRAFKAAADRGGSLGGAGAAPVTPLDAKRKALEEQHFDQISDLRTRIGDDVERRAMSSAIEQYHKLLALSQRQCLPQKYQLEIGREFYRMGEFAAAAAAFERFLECYADAAEAINVRLLLGIIHARDLRQFEIADRLLTDCLRALRDDDRRDQCLQWLRNVRSVLGRPDPDLVGP